MTERTPSTRAGRLEEIAAREKAATPGPWVAQSRDDGFSDAWWLDTHAYQEGPEPVWARSYPVSDADVAFMAAARDDIPWLLQELAEARADALREVGELRAALTDIANRGLTYGFTCEDEYEALQSSARAALSQPPAPDPSRD